MSRDRCCETCGHWLRLSRDDCDALRLALRLPYNRAVDALHGFGVCAAAVADAEHRGCVETYPATVTDEWWEADDPGCESIGAAPSWCQWMGRDREERGRHAD